jgi:hypothetical protein
MDDDKRKSKRPSLPPQVTTKPLPSPPKKLSIAVQSIKNYKRASTVKKEDKPTNISLPVPSDDKSKIKEILSPRRKKKREKEKSSARRDKYSKAKDNFQGFAKSTTEIKRVLSAPPEYTGKKSTSKRNYVTINPFFCISIQTLHLAQRFSYGLV